MVTDLSECAAVVPCLNEARTIRGLVTELRAYLPRIYVVDDGSTDGTGVEAAQAGATVLRHASPCGKGTALQTGLARAHAEGFAWALVLDGDGQHAPADIPKFATAARQGASLVVGNRLHAPAAMPWLRRWVNRWMSGRLSALSGRPLPDTQCGYRLIRLEAWAALDLRSRMFEWESESLVAFLRSGARVDFVPIATLYRGERSKISPARDTIRWFRWYLAERRRWRPAPVSNHLPRWISGSSSPDFARAKS